MAMGMTYEQYWFGDPLMVRAFYKAEKIKHRLINEQAWLYGAYVYRALDATVGNMSRKKGATPAEYPKEPINLKGDAEEDDLTKQEREDQEAVYAKAYMTNMVIAGKNWKK